MLCKEIGFVEDLAFVGAQSAAADGHMSLREQVAATVAKLKAILNEANLTFDDVVKVGLFYHQSLLGEETSLLQSLRALFDAAGPAPVATAIPLHRLPYGGLLQIELIALKRGSKRSAARRAASRDQVHGFSSALRCCDLLFVGGTASVDNLGLIVNAEDIVGQARLTMDKLKLAIKQLGAEPQSVVKLNTYYVGQGTTADWARAANVRATAFAKPGPAATGVPIPGPYPGGALLRQEAMCAVNEDGSAKHRDTSWPEGVYDWPIPVTFEQCLKLDKLIVLGGQISCSTKGETVFPGDLRAQTQRTMESMATLLGGFNKDCDCLVKLTIFYATQGDPADLDIVFDTVRPFFSKALPTLALAPLAKLGLEGLLVEIEGLGAFE